MPRLTCTFPGLGAKFYSDGEGLKIETTKSLVKKGNVSSFNPEKLSSHHFRVCDSGISDPGKLSTRDSVTEDGSSIRRKRPFKGPKGDIWGFNVGGFISNVRIVVVLLHF